MGQQFFFDRAAVTKHVDKQTRAVFSKFGAFVRQSARQLIRRRKTASRPGQAPSDRGGPLKRLIYFVYDIDRRAVVIGPQKINGAISPNEPEALEKGGRTRVVSTVNGRRTTQVAHILPRPYMGPAVKKELNTLPSIWASSVHSG